MPSLNRTKKHIFGHGYELKANIFQTKCMLYVKENVLVQHR